MKINEELLSKIPHSLVIKNNKFYDKNAMQEYAEAYHEEKLEERLKECIKNQKEGVREWLNSEGFEGLAERL